MILLRVPMLAVLALGLAACTTQVPDSGQGVGFTDYNSYLRQREAALRTGTPAPTPPGAALGGPASAAGGFSTDRIGAALDAADGTASAPVAGAPLSGTAAFDPNRPRGDAPTGIQTQTGEAVTAAGLAGSSTISDEQEFSAVSQRETIQSDAERIQRNRDQYVQIQPSALPERPADTGPNIVPAASLLRPIWRSRPSSNAADPNVIDWALTPMAMVLPVAGTRAPSVQCRTDALCCRRISVTGGAGSCRT
jgi:hypothetical protein